MRTRLEILAFIAWTCFNGVTLASNGESEVSLESQLQDLNSPINQAPSATSTEKLYAIQNRLAPLRFRHELAAGGAKNFTSDSFLSSKSNRRNLSILFQRPVVYFLGI